VKRKSSNFKSCIRIRLHEMRNAVIKVHDNRFPSPDLYPRLPKCEAGGMKSRLLCPVFSVQPDCSLKFHFKPYPVNVENMVSS